MHKDTSYQAKYMSSFMPKQVPLRGHDNMSSTKNYKIQIASDLHLEFLSFSGEDENDCFSRIIVKNADAKVLALLGDITILTTDKCREQYQRFIEWSLSQWDQVILLTGNHEYYRKGYGEKVDMEKCDRFLKQLEERFDNLHFLQKSVLDLDDCVVLGCTLWSAIPEEVMDEIRSNLNDYHSIYTTDSQHESTSSRLLKPIDTNTIHYEHIAWLKAQLELYRDREVVILTHHTPSMQGTSDPCFNSTIDKPNHMAHAFSTDLTELINDNPCIKIWAYGHTHYNNRQYFVRNSSDLSSKCLLISNQYGYCGENCKHMRNGNYRYDHSLTI